MNTPLLAGIDCIHRENYVLNDVSHDVASGESIVIVGPSGCGKSTRQQVIAGIEKPSVGTNIIYVTHDPTEAMTLAELNRSTFNR